MPSCVMSNFEGVTQHVHRLHTGMCVCVCVYQHMCVWRPLSSLAHLPRQKTPVSPAISQFDSLELDSGTREEGGRGEARPEFEEGGKKRERGQQDRHTEGVAITRSPPLHLPLFGDQVFSF